MLIHTAFANEADIGVRKEVVSVPTKYYVTCQGPLKDAFPFGFPIGFGSAITYQGKQADGTIVFYTITDRGPNADGPRYNHNGTILDGKIFPTEHFQPQIGIVTLTQTGASVVSSIGLKNTAGQPLSGLPIPTGSIGATNEAALSADLKLLGNDVNGLDPEGIAVDAAGNFWVCDEYGPFIVKFDHQGKMLKRYGPGDGLPAIMRYRIPNRGFEGLTITPTGKLVAAEQSVLDIEGKTADKAAFTRLVELDPATASTRMFAYPIDVDVYRSPKEAKIGDIAAISENKFLVIEQGKDKQGNMRNLIYEVDIEHATDLSGVKIAGDELETASPQLVQENIWFASKRLILNLRDYGWTAEKAEGIALLPDKKTLVIINDNDFGLELAVNDPARKKGKIGNYRVQPDGSVTYKEEPAAPVVSIEPSDSESAKTCFWMFTLQNPLG